MTFGDIKKGQLIYMLSRNKEGGVDMLEKKVLSAYSDNVGTINICIEVQGSRKLFCVPVNATTAETADIIMCVDINSMLKEAELLFSVSADTQTKSDCRAIICTETLKVEERFTSADASLSELASIIKK